MTLTTGTIIKRTFSQPEESKVNQKEKGNAVAHWGFKISVFVIRKCSNRVNFYRFFLKAYYLWRFFEKCWFRRKPLAAMKDFLNSCPFWCCRNCLPAANKHKKNSCCRTSKAMEIWKGVVDLNKHLTQNHHNPIWINDIKLVSLKMYSFRYPFLVKHVSSFRVVFKVLIRPDSGFLLS